MKSLPRSWSTEHVDFIAACDETKGRKYYSCPTDSGVKAQLERMLEVTLTFFNGGEVEDYELAERYPSKASLRASIDDDALENVKALQAITGQQIDGRAVTKFNSLEFYMVHFYDSRGRAITGVRRATYFRSLLKQKNRLIRWADDTLTAVRDEVFKLDWDFDFILTPTDVYILRPSNFEAIAGVEDAIAGKLPQKVKELQKRVSFLDFRPHW